MHSSLAQARHQILTTGLLDNGHRWMVCDWQALCAQLLQQWNLLTSQDLQETGPDRHRIAALVQRKYGVAYDLIDNYLANLERTLPLVEEEVAYS